MANSDPNRALLSANCHGIMHFQKLLKTHLAGVERLQSAGDFLRGSPKVTSLPRTNVRDLVSRTLEHAENHLVLLGCRNSLEKVAAFLLELDRRLEQPDVIVLPTRRCDIADYLGTTLETVSRALSSLQEEGMLSLVGTNHRRIMLHNRSRLAQRATSSRPSMMVHSICRARTGI